MPAKSSGVVCVMSFGEMEVARASLARRLSCCSFFSSTSMAKIRDLFSERAQRWSDLPPAPEQVSKMR